MSLLLFLLHVGLQSGALPVGFALLPLADSTRRTPSGEPRPIMVGVWYPARSSSAPHLTYRRYYSLPAKSGGRELDEFVAFLASHGAPPAAVRQWLDAPMLAARVATPVGGRFPLVLLAQGNAQTL